ncbi:unnamed protein product [Closterium sp. Yama58-4]|nr:unnamed protein product [Closterium sp. Yama58-4]
MAQMLRMLDDSDHNKEDAAQRMVALQQAMESGRNTLVATSTKVNWRNPRYAGQTLWQEYEATAPGDMSQLRSWLSQTPADNVKLGDQIQVRKGMAIPGDEDFTKYSSVTHYVRACPLFMKRPWYSDVAILGKERVTSTDGTSSSKDVIWYARLLMIFVAEPEDPEAELADQRERAFVRYYNVSDEVHPSHCPVLLWEEPGNEYQVVEIDSILRVAHVVPVGDNKFVLNSFKLY